MFEEDSSSSIPSIWTSLNTWFTPTVLFVLLNLVIATIFYTSTLAHPQERKEENQEDHTQNQNQNPPKLGRSPSVLQRLRSINFNNFRSQEPQQSPTKLNQTLDFDNHSQQHLEQTYQEKTLFEQTHYFFEQTIQEKTFFEETHLGENQETANPYLFDQNHLEKETPFYQFEQNHSEKAVETDNPVVFHQEQETIDQYSEEEELEEEDGEPQSLEEVFSQLTERHHVNRHVRTTSDTKPASGEIPAKLPAKMRKSASMKSAFGHFEEVVETESRRPATVRERGTRVTEGDHEVDAKADDFINKFKDQLKLQRLDSIIRYKEVINRGSTK